MFEEDDYPDYFLGDDDDQPQQPSRPVAPQRREQEASPRPGMTIDFDGDSDREPSGYGQSDSDGGSGAGCLSMGGTLGRLGCAVSFVFLLIVAVIAYVRYLTPTVSDAVMEVYVTSVQQRGVFFKTYEAEIVDPERISDTSQPYTHSVAVTIEDETLARELQRIQSTDSLVRLRYKQYSATLPWRGESKTIVTSRD